MTHAAFDHGVLIFTDRDRVAGGISAGTGPTTLLTQGTLSALITLFIDSTPKNQPTLETAINQNYPHLESDDLVRLADHMISTVPGLTKLKKPPVLGRRTTKVTAEQTELTLEDGVTTPCPAGVLVHRTVGGHPIWLSTATESLAGRVHANPTLAVVRTFGNSIDVHQLDDVLDIDPEGDEIPFLGLASADYMIPYPPYPGGSGPGPKPKPKPPKPKPPKPGPSCGVCGVCGTCALCEGINFLSAAAATTAVTMLGLAAGDVIDARRRSLKVDPVESATRITEDLLKLSRQLDDA